MVFVPKGTTSVIYSPRIQGVPARNNNNNNTPNCEANEICNFCINSIKIPIVMRIFANTIYLCVQADHEGGIPDNMEVHQYRLSEYPIPVHISHCSHDKGHLYASFGARFPGQCHKRLPLWSVVVLSLEEGGWAEGTRMAATEFSIWRQQHLHLPHPPPNQCLCLCLWPGLAGCPIMKCSSNACGINFCHNCQVLGQREEGKGKGETWLSNVYCKLANKRKGNATKRVSLFVNCVRPPTKLTPKPVGQPAA